MHKMGGLYKMKQKTEATMQATMQVYLEANGVQGGPKFTKDIMVIASETCLLGSAGIWQNGPKVRRSVVQLEAVRLNFQTANFWDGNTASDYLIILGSVEYYSVAAGRFRTASEPEPNPNQTAGANRFEPENFQGYLERIQR
ncbi:hypothetical protein B0H10DRAFT_2191072 [Mycena sp. CBHHK59/15]|nr:hypothetical protein B0H10DRAFT_2191072 [Mycena sp. CBHHK59/15]